MPDLDELNEEGVVEEMPALLESPRKFDDSPPAENDAVATGAEGDSKVVIATQSSSGPNYEVGESGMPKWVSIAIVAAIFVGLAAAALLLGGSPPQGDSSATIEPPCITGNCGGGTGVLSDKGTTPSIPAIVPYGTVQPPVVATMQPVVVTAQPVVIATPMTSTQSALQVIPNWYTGPCEATSLWRSLEGNMYQTFTSASVSWDEQVARNLNPDILDIRNVTNGFLVCLAQ